MEKAASSMEGDGGKASTPDTMEADRARVCREMEKYGYIRYTIFDMIGASRSCLLPSHSATRFLESGIGCFTGMQAIGPNNAMVVPPEVLKAGAGNAFMIPDLDTLHPIGWLSGDKYRSSTAELFCGTYWDKSTPQEACCRGILKRLLGNLDEAGYAIYSGYEVEHILLDKQTKEPIFQGNDYMGTLTQSEFHSWMVDIEGYMSKAGVTIERMHSEFSPGQFEFVTSPKFGIESIDGCALLKQCLKEVANQRGWEANFMAKRGLEEKVVGSGLHMNFSLWDKEKKKNLMWDESSSDKLSKMAKHWLAGILHHARALTAVYCHTTNDYFRLHTLLIPTRANWGIENRSTMIRVKNEGPKQTYFENRTPSGLVNPYLAMAATIAAGLDGIKKEMVCPEAADMEGATELPKTLPEALQALQDDAAMVEALGPKFMEWFVLTKTESEIKPLKDITEKTEQMTIHTNMYCRL